MKSLVKSQISIFTHDLAANLIPEINKRIALQMKGDGDKGVMGKVLYGSSGKEAVLGKKELEADWAYPIIEPYRDSQLICMSANGVPYKLHDHIFNHIVTIDPMAVVCMDYYDKANSVIGSRMLILDDEVETEGFEVKFTINPKLESVPEVLRATQIGAYEEMVMNFPWVDYSGRLDFSCAIEFD